MSAIYHTSFERTQALAVPGAAPAAQGCPTPTATSPQVRLQAGGSARTAPACSASSTPA